MCLKDVQKSLGSRGFRCQIMVPHERWVSASNWLSFDALEILRKFPLHCEKLKRKKVTQIKNYVSVVLFHIKWKKAKYSEGRQMAPVNPRPDIWRPIFGALDIWRPDNWRSGQFAPRTFCSWTFGCRDNWRPGKLAVWDIWRPDIWRSRRLAP